MISKGFLWWLIAVIFLFDSIVAISSSDYWLAALFITGLVLSVLFYFKYRMVTQ